MPYKLRKAPKRDLYWVVGDDGTKHSKEPMPRARAEAQMKALYAAMRKEGGAEPEDMDALAELPRPEPAPAPRQRKKRVPSKLDLVDKLINRVSKTEDEKEAIALARNVRKEIEASPSDLMMASRLGGLERMMERKGLKGRGRKRGGMKKADTTAHKTSARSRAGTIEEIPPINRRTATGDYMLRRSDVEPFISPITGALMRTPVGYDQSPISDAFFEGELPDRELPRPPQKKPKEAYPKNATAMEKSIVDTRNATNEYTYSKLISAYNRKHGISGRGLSGGVRFEGETLLQYVRRLETNKFFVIELGGFAAWQGSAQEAELNQAYEDLGASTHQPRLGGYTGGMESADDEAMVDAMMKEMAEEIVVIWKTLFGSWTAFRTPLTQAQFNQWRDTMYDAYEDYPPDLVNMAINIWETEDADTEDEKTGGSHRTNFLKKNNLKKKAYSLDELSQISAVPIDKLQEVYNRGIGAYKTNPTSVRLKGSYVKGVNAPMSKKLSKEQWAMARVYSFLDGNPKHDNDLRGGRISDIFRPSRVLNEIVNPQSNLRRRLVDVSKGIRKGLPPSARQTLEQYGEELIQSLTLRRDPVPQTINKAFDLITLGQWSKAKSAENYDRMFHLGLVLTLQSGKSILIEKNEVINIGNPQPLQPNSEVLSLPPLARPTTLSQFITNGVNAMGDSFYRYDPFSNNCQDFVAKLLQANSAYSNQASLFVKQPVESLLSRLPSWTHSIARGITDLGALANVAVEGAGHDKFTAQLSKAGLSSSVYLKTARKKAKEAGYKKLVEFAKDGVHKLAIPNEEGKLIPFGRVGYGDFIIWSHLEKAKKTPHGSAEDKRENYRLRAEKIRGDWQKNPFSPNNLAIRILW